MHARTHAHTHEKPTAPLAGGGGDAAGDAKQLLALCTAIGMRLSGLVVLALAALVPATAHALAEHALEEPSARRGDTAASSLLYCLASDAADLYRRQAKCWRYVFW